MNSTVLNMILASGPNGMSAESLTVAGVKPVVVKRLVAGLLIEARTHHFRGVDVTKYHVTSKGAWELNHVERGRERAAGEGRLWSSN